MSLQDLCLKTIVDEFERYYLAFTTSDDHIVKRMFEFLQKKYSFQLATSLYDSDKIQDKYMDFLINKYLKVVDTGWFMNCSWKTVTTKFAEVGSNIEKIFFHDIYLEEHSEEIPWQDIICYLPNVEVLSFQHDCQDEILKSIARFCPNIVEIDLRNSRVTNEGAKQLCIKENGKASCSKLKKLLISATAVKDDGMKHLIQNLPSLEVIDYSALPHVLYGIHYNDLQILDKIPPYKITCLDLLNYGYSGFFPIMLKICLALCPRLKSLICPVMNEEDLNIILKSEMTDLEKLQLECYSNTEININNFLKTKGHKITSLTIHNCTVSIPVLAESCPYLKQLSLNKINFLCGYDFKSKFYCLESCAFECAINDSTAAEAVSLILSSSPKLEDIEFKRCSLSCSEMKTHILKCCEHFPIKRINFSGSIVDLQFIKDVLLNCHSLKSLILDGCDFNINEEGEICRFAEILPNNPEIYFSEQLSISDYDDFLNDFEDLDSDDDYDDFYLNHNDYDYDYDDVDEEDDEYGYDFEL